MRLNWYKSCRTATLKPVQCAWWERILRQTFWLVILQHAGEHPKSDGISWWAVDISQTVWLKASWKYIVLFLECDPYCELKAPSAPNNGSELTINNCRWYRSHFGKHYFLMQRLISPSFDRLVRFCRMFAATRKPNLLAKDIGFPKYSKLHTHSYYPCYW